MPPEGKARKSKQPDRSAMPTMSSLPNQEVPAVPPPPTSPGSRKEDWIANQLRRVYDEAVHEGIPQSMLDLLDALDDGAQPDERPDEDMDNSEGGGPA